MAAVAYKNIEVEGLSVGGVENCYALPRYQVGFDIGRCPAFMVDVANIFISHGHLDHAAGIPYYFSQRSLRGVKGGKIYVPVEIEKPLVSILKNWQTIESFGYPIEVQGLQKQEEVELNKNHFVKALPSYHRVPSLGYVLCERRYKLKEEFLNYSQKEIIDYKKKGTEITFVQDTPLFAYSGDTSIEFVLENPTVQKAKVLFLECTYIDDERPVQRARDWGHTHLYEIIEHASLFQNEKIFLVHFSRRYPRKRIEQQLRKKLPLSLQERVEIFLYE